MTGTLMVSSRSTSIKSILLSARQAKHCMTAPVSLPAQTGARPPDALCVSFEEVRARVASRQAAPPSSHVSLRSADIETAPHRTRCEPRSRRQRKVEDQLAVGLQGTNQSGYALRRPQVSKKRGLLPRSLFAVWSALPCELNAARTTCGRLERRPVVGSRYPWFQCGGLDHLQLLSD